MTNLPISREIKLQINWSELITKLTEFAGQSFLTAFGGDGVSGGISALVAAAASLKGENEPGRNIWSITILCFAWTLDELKSDVGTDVPSLKVAFRNALEQARLRVDEGLETCPITFLERPTTLPLYKRMRDVVIANKSLYRSGSLETDQALAARFDAAFNRSMFQILSMRLDLYSPISSLFQLPSIAASDLELSWTYYRKKLVHEFEVRPVFGQELTKISLSQIYIPLRGCWVKDDIDYNPDIKIPLDRTHEISYIEDELEKWIQQATDDDWVRLIGGGPGSGKSTTLKSLARKMADKPDWRTLFIPLQHLNLDVNLRDEINNYFTDRTGGAFTQPPLSRAAIEDGPSILLIFDGLDELARPGEAANEIVNLFATKLSTLNSSLRGDSAKVIRAVVSGRTLAFQAAKRFLTPPKKGCIEVHGFTPLSSNGPQANKLWYKDQRPDWWSKYATLLGEQSKTPAAFSSPELAGITHEPLLCYLLVLSGFATQNWREAADNPNRIYTALINSVWERGWGDGSIKRQGPGKALSKADFNFLMQTIALAAWQDGDTRVASETGFVRAIKIAQAEDVWESFKADNGPDVTNLAMNFYLKSSEHKHRGFEFTHKSFGDYLAARAILDLAEQLSPSIDRKVDHAMTDWLDATGAGKLTAEILRFLRDEVRLRLSDRSESNYEGILVKFKNSFERFVLAIASDGLPAYIGANSWRLAETRQRNSETMAWAALNSFSLGLARAGRTEKYINLDTTKNYDDLNKILRRLTSNPEDKVVLKCFSYIIAPKSNLFGLDLSGIDLRGARMPRANFNGCILIGANLAEADMTRATFERAMLDQVDVFGTIFDGADLRDARLPFTNLEKSKTRETLVSFETIFHANSDAFRAPLLGFRYSHDHTGRVLNDSRRIKERTNSARRIIERLQQKKSSAIPDTGIRDDEQ